MTGRRQAVLRGAAIALVAVGCGDNLAPDIRPQLEALPGVTVEPQETAVPHAHYYALTFEEPIDHAHPERGTFPLHVSLLHHDLGAPLVALTSGYFDFYGDHPAELTALLDGNQASIEHRFYGESVPDLAADPAAWTYLTIAQMAADEHDVVTALASIYPGPVVATGGSKGGMTALFFQRFYPDDVDATVAYVAPLTFGAPDGRYPEFLVREGGPDQAACRTAVRAAATEMLANRRAALEQRASDQAAMRGYTYTRIALPAAVESAVTALEFQFWQYLGVGHCDLVPPASATDEALWRFLQAVAPVSDSDDEQTVAFAPYVYQAYAELGYPDLGLDYLEPYLRFTDADYAGALPVAQPPYDGGAAMRDIASWLAANATHTLALYGEWDPWTAGAIPLPAGTITLINPAGTHDSQLVDLPAADRAAASAALAAWTGVTPALGRTASTQREAPRRVPPAALRALNRRIVRP